MLGGTETPPAQECSGELTKDGRAWEPPSSRLCDRQLLLQNHSLREAQEFVPLSS